MFTSPQRGGLVIFRIITKATALLILSIFITLPFFSFQGPSDEFNLEDNDSLSTSVSRAPAWWDVNWTYRMKLTFNNSNQSQDLLNFPVMVNLSASNFNYSNSNPNGSDLRFVDDDNITKLRYEVESWNNSGNSYFWVNVTKIDANSTTDHIWLYYGNPNALDQSDPNSVWDVNYTGVWHLDEEWPGKGNASIYNDSTSYNNHGDDNVTASNQSGRINGGQEFGGSGDWINVSHNETLNLTGEMTISFWIYASENTTTFNRVVEKGIWGYQTSYYFGCGDGSNDITFYLNGTEIFDTPDGTFSNRTWYYAAVNYSSDGNATLFLNGIKIDNGTYTGIIPGNEGDLYISYPSVTYDFGGYIDEVRISNIARSGDWLRAQFLSQNDTFITYGEEEVRSVSLPEFLGIDATPDPQVSGGCVNITVSVIGVPWMEEVWVNITSPNMTRMNLSMSKGLANRWYYNRTYTALGVYNYTVHAMDYLTNWNLSTGHNFTIIPGPPDRILKISGDGQSGTVGTQLAEPLVVEVQDKQGNMVPGAKVWFNVTTGNGSVNSTNPAITNGTGRASASFQLGNLTYLNTVVAEIFPTILGRVNFTATCIPDAMARIELLPGSLNVTVNATHNFSLRGYDKYDNDITPAGTFWKTTAGILILHNDTAATLRALTSSKTGAYVKAMVGGLEANATVNVVPDVLDHISIIPDDVDVMVDSIQNFTASGFDGFHNRVGLMGTAWDTNAGAIIASNDTHATFQAQGDPMDGGQVTVSIGNISAAAIVDVFKILNPPDILGHVPDVQLFEDDPPFTLSLDKYESDVEDSGIGLDWYITGWDKTLYSVSGERSQDDSIIITPCPDMHGDDLVTLWLTDSDNLTASQPLWINITPINDPPVFKDPPDLVMRYDEPYVFDYDPYIWDKETSNSDLNLQPDEKVEGQHTSISGLNVTYEYPLDLLDQEIYVVLMVSDGMNHTFQTIKVKVTSNYVPQLKEDLPDVTLNEGETLEDVFDLDDYFTDPDGDVLLFSYVGGQVDVVIGTDNSVDISSPGEWHGVDTVTFRAKDISGGIAEDTIKVTVLPINDPPAISGVPDLIVRYDEGYTFDLFYYISDVDNDTEELRVSFVDVTSKAPLTGVWTDPVYNLVMHILYTAEWIDKEIPVRIIVSDGIAFSYQDITVTISDDWPPELLKELKNVRFDEDTILENAFNLNDHFYDRDEEMLFYTSGHRYVNITINDDDSVDFSAPRDFFGEEYVTFRATDTKGALVESKILVTVFPVNDPPVIEEIPALYIGIGLENFDLSPYISDVDSELLSVTIGSGEENLVVFVNGFDLVIISEAGLVTTLVLNVTDGEDHASGTLELIIEGEVPGEGEDELDVYQILFVLIIILILLFILVFLFVYLRGFYKVEALYLIYSDGRLIKYLQRGGGETGGDEEIMSGMFTAIQDLIDDTFTHDGAFEIKRKKIQFEGKNILIEKGDDIYLTLIIKGRPGRSVYNKMKGTVRAIEKQYPEFKQWQGRRHELKGIERHFEKFLPIAGEAAPVEKAPEPPHAIPVPEQGTVPSGSEIPPPPEEEEGLPGGDEFEEDDDGFSVFKDLEDLELPDGPMDEDEGPDVGLGEDVIGDDLQSELEGLLEESWGDELEDFMLGDERPYSKK